MRPQGRQIAAAVCLVFAVVCGIAGRMCMKAHKTLPVSAASRECVTAAEIRRIRESEAMREDAVDFAAWREDAEARVTTEDGFSGTQATLIRLSGSSEYLLPGEHILDEDDANGCLIGEAVAERLFGSRAAGNLTVVCGERTLTVRGVLRDAAEIIVFEDTAADASFDRFIFAPCVKENVCEAFFNRYGLSRMQICGRGPVFRNLIPGKISDFAGWRSNLAAEEKRLQRQREQQMSVFELREETHRRKGGILLAAGVAFLLAGLTLPGTNRSKIRYSSCVRPWYHV